MPPQLLTILESGALVAARELLGWELYNQIDGQLVGGRIIETEAYTEEDPASHTYRGQTLRTAPMFQTAGHLYIYFTYGMHWCMNLVTGPAGHGEAVLLRGLEPLKGIDTMLERRGVNDLTQLCNGPAKLVQALGVKPDWTGKEIKQTSLQFRLGKTPKHIITSPRIGITQATEALWRFQAQ